MTEIGGISKSNGILLLDPTKDDVDNAFKTISGMMQKKHKDAKRSEFVFYYSGHSDENALLLGKTTYDYSSLKAAITNVPSDVHVVILDSCYSGNFIRTKGGQKQKPFLMDDSSVVKGHAYLSSSSSQESSQESDEIGSSFFTNGASFSATKTENTADPQHPNYNITLVVSGDLVLSDISASDCVLTLPRELIGRVILRDKNGTAVLALPDAVSSGAVEAFLPGYQTASVSFFASDRAVQISLAIVDVIEGQTLVVNRASPEETEEKTGVASVMTKEEMHSTANIGIMEDCMSAFRTLPGVSYSGAWGTEPSIRGAEPREFSCLFDGMYTLFPWHWGGGISIFNPTMVKSVKLSNGIFSAKYGRASSGLLEATSIKPDCENFHLNLGIATTSADAFANGRVTSTETTF